MKVLLYNCNPKEFLAISLLVFLAGTGFIFLIERKGIYGYYLTSATSPPILYPSFKTSTYKESSLIRRGSAGGSANAISANFSHLTLWSSDFHISPIADIKHLLSRFGVKVIDKSLSGHCSLMSTCARDIRVIDRENGISLGACPNHLRTEFYEAYIDNEEMSSVDGFLCNHAISMCELFMPFGKPMIAIASTRYEIGRHELPRWLNWNENLRRISNKWYNTIAANNFYDKVSFVLLVLASSPVSRSGSVCLVLYGIFLWYWRHTIPPILLQLCQCKV
jgi:hypothetical protein